MTFEVIFHFIKKMCVLITMTFLKSFKRLGVKQKIYRRKDDFEILR